MSFQPSFRIVSLQDALPEPLITPAGVRFAGVDEAGRGPLAGAVYAAAVVLEIDKIPLGLTDSKKLTAKKRNYLEQQIKEVALEWSVASASAEEIDRLNILQATLLAMSRAISALSTPLEQLWVDGNHSPSFVGQVYGVIKGDMRVPVISAASILAKEARDREMLELAEKYPEYGFEQHKGYPTIAHREAIERYGVSPVHRKSFKPVSSYLARES